MVGFDARNRDTINGSFICRLCNLILREPCQLSCGHRQCKTCIENAEGPVIQCTECSEQTQKNEIMPDRGFKNDMKALLIICSFCLWNGLFKDYEEHLKSTHPNPMCEFCKERFNSTTRLEEHKQKECTKITVPCPLKEFGCSEPVCRAQLPEHYLTESHQKAIIKAIRLLKAKALNEPYERVLGMDIDNGQSASSTMMTTTSENISSQMQEIYETI
ncbi:unnamed protein product, partial [Rotaria socialis]